MKPSEETLNIVTLHSRQVVMQPAPQYTRGMFTDPLFTGGLPYMETICSLPCKVSDAAGYGFVTDLSYDGANILILMVG